MQRTKIDCRPSQGGFFLSFGGYHIVFNEGHRQYREQQKQAGGNMSDIETAANLAEVIRAHGKARGKAIAFEFEGRRTSYAEFDLHTNRVANALAALGIEPGVRIAYLGKNSDVYFELLLGVIRANVVMAPVNWRLACPEIAFIVEDCKAPVLFVGPEFIEQVRGIQTQLPGVRTFITTEGGAPDWPDYLPWRDAQSDSDPKVPIGERDVAIQLIPPARPASRKARCSRI